MKEKEVNLTASQKISSKLNDFIGRHAKLLVAIAALVIVLIIVLAVALTVMQSASEKKFNDLLDLEVQYSSLSLMSSDDEAYQSTADEFIKSADALIVSSSLKEYPGAKAELLLADLAFSQENYQEAADLAVDLINRFLDGEIQQVELLYNHFKSTSTQVLTRETYLPIDLSSKEDDEHSESSNKEADYIIEPSAERVMQELLPKVLRMKVYTALLDSNASEHAARMMAMQVATDNANDLIQELTLLYNKSRQQAITNELLDIVGGTMA